MKTNQLLAFDILLEDFVVQKIQYESVLEFLVAKRDVYDKAYSQLLLLKSDSQYKEKLLGSLLSLKNKIVQIEQSIYKLNFNINYYTLLKDKY